jgi:uncharacterized protein YjbJ (UPF0337 family)
MNDDVLRNHWPELKDKIKRQWEKLDDQDLNLINGDMDMLIGNLQAAYGWSKEEAQQRYHEFEELHLAPR